MRLADSACRPSGELNANLGGLSVPTSELRRRRLAWWDLDGRHTIPWKRQPDGSPAADGEPLDPYPIWCAEVMRAARQHSRAGKGPIACALLAFGRS
jgi:hypothetical protein